MLYQNVILQITWNRSSILLYCSIYSIYLSIGIACGSGTIFGDLVSLKSSFVAVDVKGCEGTRRRCETKGPYRRSHFVTHKGGAANWVAETRSRKAYREERCRGEWHATSRRNAGGISAASRCSFVTGWLSSPHSVEADTPVVRDLHVVRECTWCILCRDELVFIRRPGNFADRRSGILTWRGANF